jgi:hypothetical protein
MVFDVEEMKFRRWLGLTQQQYDIVKIVYRLRNRGAQPSPKNIQKEYRTEYNKYLMKPNLFNILRMLQSKKIVRKSAHAEYSLDQAGIMETLVESKKRLLQDVDDLDRTHDQVDQFFREITYRKEQPDIQYLEGDELYSALAELVEKSSVFSVIADFPTISYGREMTHTLQRETYAESLWQALKNKKTRIVYLTPLNMDLLFNHAVKTFGDPKLAYQECVSVIDRLKTQMETHKNLDVRYVDVPQGIDMAVAQQKEPTEFIMFTRDEHDEIQGGIRIRSHKTAANALRAFQHAFDQASPLNSPQGKQLLQKIKQSIRLKYGILGE